MITITDEMVEWAARAQYDIENRREKRENPDCAFAAWEYIKPIYISDARRVLEAALSALPDAGGAQRQCERLIDYLSGLKTEIYRFVDEGERPVLEPSYLLADDRDLIVQALRAPQPPDGWVMVPREPTKEMIIGGLIPTSVWQNIPSSALTNNREKMRLRYKAMLAAAPKPGG